ncbi:MAG: hypothetical protein ACHQ9S_14275 [Candidatus Binatia bacterium]
MSKLSTPEIVGEVRDEIKPGDPAIWQPRSFEEWVGQQRANTILGAWSEQMTHERSMRSFCAKCIFGLIGFQVLAVFTIVILQGRTYLALDTVLIKILIPSVLTNVFGLGLIVVKYLFSEPVRLSLDALIGKEVANGP